MYYKLSFLVFVLFIASCKKEEIPEPTIQYDIYVNDWNPDLVSTGNQIDLDLNGDGKMDYEFETHSGSNWYDSAGDDVYYIWNYEVLDNYLLDTTFKIATYNDTTEHTLFVQGEMINENALWESNPYLYGKRWWDHPNFNNVEFYYNPFEVNNGDGYVGVKRSVNGKIYYGWLKLKVEPYKVTFYESGFNQIPNVPIRIGQTQ